MQVPTVEGNDVSVEELLDRGRSVDCAIRLGQPAWAAASAERLALDLNRHEQHMARAWRGLDGAATDVSVSEARAVRTALRSLAAELRLEGPLTRADVYDRLQTLIHREAVAAGDTAWRVLD